MLVTASTWIGRTAKRSAAPERRRRRNIDPQEEPREQQRDEDVQEQVDGVERHGIAAVDPPLDREGEQQDGPVGGARARLAAEVLGREDLVDALGPRIRGSSRTIALSS